MLNVTKSSLAKEPFDENKIKSSLQRAHVPEDLQKNVISQVSHIAYDEIFTSKIHDEISDYLGKSDLPFTKSMYRMKQAVMELGPTGYPFEDFISEILGTLGYTTKVRQMLMGKCVSHEIDCIAQKGVVQAMIEAKFHNVFGKHTDVRTPLYVKSRFEDVKDKHGLTEAWVITNTKVSSDAVVYSNCVGMKIISWNYPDGGSLRDLIEKSGVHPITMLTTLSMAQKTELLNNHIVRCKMIHEDPTILDPYSLSNDQKKKVLEEASFICRGEHPTV